MISLSEYITINEGRAKSLLPPELEKKYEDILWLGDYDELKPKDFEFIYKILMDAEILPAWDTCKPVFQAVHDGNLEALHAWGKADLGEGDKEIIKETTKIRKAFQKLLSTRKFADDSIGYLMNRTAAYFFNKLKPKEKIDLDNTNALSDIFTGMRDFSDYFTDKEKEAKKKEMLAKLPPIMRKWYDKCRSFVYAGGVWGDTKNPTLKAMDFGQDFSDACKEFDFTKIKGLPGYVREDLLVAITDLVHALNKKDKEEIKKAFAKYKDTRGPEPWWYQSDLQRDDPGGVIAQAALTINMAWFLGISNYWPDGTIETMEKYLDKKLK